MLLGVGPGRTVDSLLPSELAAGLYDCTRDCGTNQETARTAYWEFGTIRCQQQDQPVGLWLTRCTRMKYVLGIRHDTLPVAGSASRSVSLPVEVQRMKYHGTVV